ncbi:MAG: hypothetical protein KGO05_09775, partial [Chloroflexota bacterium]|nr:hypothetical protein [Chloroflexota bacterium]
MRIIVAHTRLTTLGGGERVTLELVRRLRARHAVTLLTSDYAPARTFAGLAELAPRIVAPALWLAQPLAADAIIAQDFGARLLALRHRRVIVCVHT